MNTLRWLTLHWLPVERVTHTHTHTLSVTQRTPCSTLFTLIPVHLQIPLPASPLLLLLHSSSAPSFLFAFIQLHLSSSAPPLHLRLTSSSSPFLPLYVLNTSLRSIDPFYFSSLQLNKPVSFHRCTFFILSFLSSPKFLFLPLCTLQNTFPLISSVNCPCSMLSTPFNSSSPPLLWALPPSPPLSSPLLSSPLLPSAPACYSFSPLRSSSCVFPRETYKAAEFCCIRAISSALRTPLGNVISHKKNTAPRKKNTL